MSSVLQFTLSIPAPQYLQLYQGAASKVTVRTENNLVINFPANILRPYVTHNGVHGRFAIYFTELQKFERIVKLD